MNCIEETTFFKQNQKEHLEAIAKSDQIKRYREALTKYGIIPFLMVLQRFENEERYELCQLIKDTVQRHNLTQRTTYPITLTKELKKQEIGIIKSFMHTDFSFDKRSYKKSMKLFSQQCYNYLLSIPDNCSPIYIDLNPYSDNWIHKFKP